MKITKIAKVLILTGTIAITSIGLVGCGGEKTPTKTVSTYFNNISKGDFEKNEGLILPPSEEESKFLEDLKNSEALKDSKALESIDVEKLTKETDETLKKTMSKLKAKINSEEIKENEATVNVTVTGPNVFESIVTYFKKYFTEGMKIMFSGDEAVEEKSKELAGKAQEMLLEEIKAAKESERTGALTLKKVEDKWKISVNEEVFILVLGDLNLDNLF